MGKLLVVSQERQARTRMKIMENECVRKNKKAKYYKREKIRGRELQIFRGVYREKIIEDTEKLEWVVAKRQEEKTQQFQ